MIRAMGLGVAAVLLTAGSVLAADEDVLPGMGKKLVFGLVDTATGIVELPVQIVKGYKNGISFIENRPASATVGTLLGILRGLGHTAGRTAHGAINVVTFWSANREDNHGIGIPLDAEFPWQWGTQYSIFKPTLKEGLMPYPRKLGHGLADGFLGMIDVPVQIAAGTKEENAVVGVSVGVVRGLWYGVSRTATGFGDAILFLAPNPAETRGYAYRDDWPWARSDAEPEEQAPAMP